MSFSAATLHSLRRVFHEGFVVRDVAEPLISFDDVTPAGHVREMVTAEGIEFVGVRRGGRVAGFAEVSQLHEGTCGDHWQPFRDELVIDGAESLARLVLRLREHRRLFVMLLGGIGGLVSRTDLQKPPMRMWLFGIITLVEMRLVRTIEDVCPEERWRQWLSPARVEKAEQLQAERQRRGQAPSLLECLQFSDKVQIYARNETLRATTRFESRRQLERAGTMLEKLRNNLAHSQDIIAHDWEAIVDLAERLDAVLEA